MGEKREELSFLRTYANTLGILLNFSIMSLAHQIPHRFDALGWHGEGDITVSNVMGRKKVVNCG